MWWDVLVVLVGALGEKRQVVAHVAVFTIGGLIVQATNALAVTTTGYVGEAIGAEDAPLARRLYRMFTLVSCLVTAVVSLAMVLFAPQLSACFSRDAITLRVIIMTLRISAVAAFCSGLGIVFAGIMRLCRRSRIVAYVFLFQNFIVSLGFALLLSFYFHFGVYGVWAASGIGTGVGLLILMCLCARIDFNEEVEQSRIRVLTERHVGNKTPLL